MKRIFSNIFIIGVFVFLCHLNVYANTELTEKDLVSTEEEIKEGIYRFSLNGEEQGQNVQTEILYLVEGNLQKQEMEAYRNQRAAYNYKSKLDSTMSYEHYTRVYYTESGNRARVTKVSGGYTQKDNSVTLVSQSLVIGQGNIGQSFVTNKNPSSSSWSFSTPSSWPSIDVSSGAIMGARYTITLRRNAGSWTSELSNHVYDNVAIPSW